MEPLLFGDQEIVYSYDKFTRKKVRITPLPNFIRYYIYYILDGT